MRNNGNPDIWSDAVLNERIATFGYQMAEMGRLQQKEDQARAVRDEQTARYYGNHAETYRNAAQTLKTEIAAQIVLRGSNALIAP